MAGKNWGIVKSTESCVTRRMVALQVGDSILYFVDRFRDFSIYDVYFKPIPNAPANPTVLAGMHSGVCAMITPRLPSKPLTWLIKTVR